MADEVKWIRLCLKRIDNAVQWIREAHKASPYNTLTDEVKWVRLCLKRIDRRTLENIDNDIMVIFHMFLYLFSSVFILLIFVINGAKLF
jgi:hypothetical protein